MENIFEIRGKPQIGDVFVERKSLNANSLHTFSVVKYSEDILGVNWKRGGKKFRK